MTKLEAKDQVLSDLIDYFGTANQRYVYPHFNEQAIKKLVQVSNEFQQKTKVQLEKVLKKTNAS